MRRALLLAATVATGAAGCRSGATVRLGAIADTYGATPATLANLARMSGVFRSEHVQAVLALGDLGATEDDIATVLRTLGAADATVYALPGELEPEGAFHAAVTRVRGDGVDVCDLVERRQVRVGGATLVAIPGYRFSSHGYRYGAADLDRARTLAATRGKVIVAAHAPPKGRGDKATDWAIGDVNAGDPALTELLRALHPATALFAHVDEAGGRADALGVNVGSAGAGMAALVEVGDGAAQARVLR